MPGPPSAQQTYGPILIGAFLSSILYGVLLVQFFTYFQSSQRDAWWMKLLLAYLFVAETAGTAFNIALVFEPLLINYGSLKSLVTSPVFLRTDGAVTVAISAPVQIFMAWRIKVLTKSSIIPGIITLFALAATCGGVWTSISVTQKPNFIQFEEFKAAPSTWLVASAVGDVIITVTLVYFLSKKKSGFAIMDSYLSHIILITIQTGALTAVGALADAIVFLSVPHSTIFFIWDLSLSKLYTTTILSSLNARNSPKRPDQNALFNSSEISSRTDTTKSHVNMYPSALRLSTVTRKSMAPSNILRYPNEDQTYPPPGHIRGDTGVKFDHPYGGGGETDHDRTPYYGLKVAKDVEVVIS